MNRSQAIAYRRKIEHAAAQQTDEDALQSIELFKKWEPDIDVALDERLQYNDILYRVLQPHRTQADWTPDKTPALWTVVSLEEWPEWKQPAGSGDAYALGAHVSHLGKHWESEYPNNVWEPGVYGWKEV